MVKPYLRLRTQIALLLSMLTLISLACLAPVATIDTKPADMTTEKTSHATAAPRQMVVCRSGGLNFRIDAGTENALAQPKPLKDGTLVTITGAEVLDDWGYPWMPIHYGGLDGFVYYKYLCEVK